MASIFTHTFDQTIEVRRASIEAHEWQAIQIKLASGGSISLSREEAAQLAADLLNAVEAAPVEAQQDAALANVGAKS